MKLIAYNLLLTCFLLIILPFCLNIKIRAEIVTRINERIYELKNDFVFVSEKRIFNISQSGWVVPKGTIEQFTVFLPNIEEEEYKKEREETINSIKLVDKNNNPLPFSITDLESGDVNIELEIQNKISSMYNEEIILEYKTKGLSLKTGSIIEVFIPGFSKDQELKSENSEFIINTKLIAPITSGEINFSQPKPFKRLDTDTHYVFEFSSDQLIGKQAWVQFGTRQFFEFIIKQEIPETSPIPFGFNTVKMPIPRDIKSGPIQQDVYYNSIIPEPSNIKEDADGNLIIEFLLPTNVKSNIYIKGYGVLNKDNDFEIDNAGKLEDISNEFQSHLKSSNYWEVNSPQIQITASQINNGENDINEIIQKTFDFVVDKIDYSFVKRYGINNRQGALKTLNGGSAVCMEYSDLFITLLRAQGVPARAAFGYGFASSDYEARQNNTINHQWAEVYLPNQDTWINVDTTWGEFGNSIIGGDLNHFYSHVSSTDPENPRSIEGIFFGQIQKLPERDYKINIIDYLNEEIYENGTRPDELIIKYPEKNVFNHVIFTMEKGTTNTLDAIDELLIQLFPFKSFIAIRAISVTLVAIPFALIFLFIFNIFIEGLKSNR